MVTESALIVGMQGVEGQVFLPEMLNDLPLLLRLGHTDEILCRLEHGYEAIYILVSLQKAEVLPVGLGRVQLQEDRRHVLPIDVERVLANHEKLSMDLLFEAALRIVQAELECRCSAEASTGRHGSGHDHEEPYVGVT